MGSNASGFNKIQDIQGAQLENWTVAEATKKPAGMLLLTLILMLYISGCGLTSGGTKNGLNNAPSLASLNITTTSLSAGQTQATYHASMAASGGKQPYAWKIAAGSLPAGLYLTGSTGTISGKPSQSGIFKFSAQVNDSSSPLRTATQSLAISISTASQFQITTGNLPAGQVGTKYQAALAASGGTQPYSWSVTSGSLPSGLGLNSSTGVLSGSPTQQGLFGFTIQATDSASLSASVSLSITVAPNSSNSSSLTITTSSLPDPQVSQPYSATVTASGGQVPYTWGLGSNSGPLPAGLTLSATTGSITGTSTTAGVYSFTIQVSDTSSPQQTASRSYTITTTIGVALDQYGGRQDIKCATVTPYFHLEKIGNRWYFCTPAGNAFVAMNVGNVLTNNNPTLDCQGNNTYPIYAAKYGDATYNWGWQTLKRMTAWGFNSVGQDSTGTVQPWQTCSNCVWPGGKQPVPLPYFSELRPAEYAAVNRFGYLTEPMKDEIAGTNGNYTTWRGGAMFDAFDPKLNTELQTELAQQTQTSYVNIRNNYPYLAGIFTDDSDWFQGFGAGPDFNSGFSNPNIAYVTLITSPVQTLNRNPQYAPTQTFLYQNTVVYSKAQATNPTIPCSISNPCSLRDYLWQKYAGSISALNTAWGSNYTAFDSTGTQVTGETMGTGDGTTTSFTHTLGHAPVSPLSVLVLVGGTAEAGDCPWFHPNCNSSTANQGTLANPNASYITQSTSIINYSTGSLTINFVNPPASGTAITVNYIYNGWMSGGTGLMDESGSNSWVGTNNFCLEGADPNYPTYFACIGASGKPVPNANPALGADLDSWIPEFSANFFKTMHDDLKAVTQIPYFGLDDLGSWGTPAYSEVLKGAAPYLDGAFVTVYNWAPAPSPATFQSAYQYLTQYLGDVPLMDFSVINAQADSDYYCQANPGPNNMGTQANRGQQWYNTVSYLLSTPGHNGTYPFVGFDWWSWQDFQNVNQGLVDLHDNAYDGHEDVLAAVPCSNPLQAYTCGRDTGNYGDVITQVKAANLFWLTY